MIEQHEYAEIINASIFTPEGIEGEYGVPARNIRDWMSMKRTPRKENQQKMQEVLMDVRNKPKMEKHPSYGWATPEQIEQIQSLGIGPTRDRLIKQVIAQNKKKGKLK